VGELALSPQPAQRICGRAGCGHRLIASGGALLGSPAWMQIFADVLGDRWRAHARYQQRLIGAV
jgi:sugar (pentulose or hexulose) kinase